jgi:hypothetical protein
MMGGGMLLGWIVLLVAIVVVARLLRSAFGTASGRFRKSPDQSG